jgi:hypothetical protein
MIIEHITYSPINQKCNQQPTSVKAMVGKARNKQLAT